MVFNDNAGIYTYTYEAEKKEDCLACSRVPQTLKFTHDSKLQEIIDYLINADKYQMKSPGITTTFEGKNRTLYIQSIPSIEERTRANLKKSLKELGLNNEQELIVADETSPNSLIFKLQLS